MKLSTLVTPPQPDDIHYAVVQHVDGFYGQAFDGRASNVIDAMLAALNYAHGP